MDIFLRNLMQLIQIQNILKFMKKKKLIINCLDLY